MPKRLTATEKWLDPWFCSLSIVDRLFWLYLLDNCDHAGIWQVNPLLVNTYFPGYSIDPSRFGDRLQILTSEKWFIRKFVDFQYGALNQSSKPHASVLKRLKKEGVSKGLSKGYLTIKDKDKDKDKDKAKEKKLGIGPQERGHDKFDFEMIWDRYPRRMGKKAAERHFKASVRVNRDWLDIQNALDCFLRQMAKESRPNDKIPYGSTWFNNWREWVNYTEGNHAPNGGESFSVQLARRNAEREAQKIREKELARESVSSGL